MKRLIETAVLVMLAGQVMAGVEYKNEKGSVELGGRIQLQYYRMDPKGGEVTDDLMFRRLRPYIEGTVHEDWMGKFEFDLGKSEVQIKDAYFKYSGLGWMDVIIGNANFCFSRELLTSSKSQQLVERTFVGDHNFGTPDRQAGVHLSGAIIDKLLCWNIGLAKAAIDPSNSRLDFDTTIQVDAGIDWLQGDMVGGRLELFPLAYFKPSQGDFNRELKVAAAVGAFIWKNDKDHINTVIDTATGASSTSSSDVDAVTGVEVSAALRVAGISVDAEYNMFDAELINGKAGNDGIYKDGQTTLSNYAIEGGVMVWPSRVELVAGYQRQDADGYASAWNRTSVGANVFVAKHDVKYQLTYTMNENKDGKKDNDADELFVQAQYVF